MLSALYVAVIASAVVGVAGIWNDFERPAV
jgi:hypothetical protein